MFPLQPRRSGRGPHPAPPRRGLADLVAPAGPGAAPVVRGLGPGAVRRLQRAGSGSSGTANRTRTRPAPRQWRFDVQHLQRWALRTPLPADRERHESDVRGGFGAPQANTGGRCHRGRQAGCGHVPNRRHRGPVIRDNHVGVRGDRHDRGKETLVGAVQAPLCSGGLRFRRRLELTPVLVAELQNFRVTVDEQTRNESFAAWRSSRTMIWY